MFSTLFPQVRTVNSLSTDDRHTPLDGMYHAMPIVEATDDSILMAESWKDLNTLVASSETFQDAHGIATHWGDPKKTRAFKLGAPLTDPPSMVRFTLDPSSAGGDARKVDASLGRGAHHARNGSMRRTRQNAFWLISRPSRSPRC